MFLRTKIILTSLDGKWRAVGRGRDVPGIWRNIRWPARTIGNIGPARPPEIWTLKKFCLYIYVDYNLPYLRIKNVYLGVSMLTFKFYRQCTKLY